MTFKAHQLMNQGPNSVHPCNYVKIMMKTTWSMVILYWWKHMCNFTLVYIKFVFLQ